MQSMRPNFFACSISFALIVRAIITLGRSLGLEVVAEGVETAKHLQGLREVGCEIVQGFLLGRPAPFADISELFLRSGALAKSA